MYALALVSIGLLVLEALVAISLLVRELMRFGQVHPALTYWSADA